MLKLTQTFLLTDGQISRVSEMRRVFEDDRLYDQVFRQARLKADSRHILLCYKIQFRLRKLANEIAQKGQSKYWFISRARYLLWALLCQGLLRARCEIRPCTFFTVLVRSRDRRGGGRALQHSPSMMTSGR
jgi:hypothetical protein